MQDLLVTDYFYIVLLLTISQFLQHWPGGAVSTHADRVFIFIYF